ncbi:MAG: VWA domain-containing protein [Verrucomicrobiota bacterium]
MNFYFQHWTWLIASPFLIAAAVMIFIRGRNLALKKLSRFASPRLNEFFNPIFNARFKRIRFSLWIAAVLLCCLALAQPVSLNSKVRRPRRGIDVMIVLDTSRSMLATDEEPNRLEKTKKAIGEMLQYLGGDRVGIVTFAGGANFIAPLTADYDALKDTLRQIDTEDVPQKGTYLGAGLEQAARYLQAIESRKKIIVMISDGEEMMGAPDFISQDNRLMIFTVGVGTEQGSRIPLTSGEYVKNAAGVEVVSKLKKGKLEKLASQYEGSYTHLNDLKGNLIALYDGALGRFSAPTEGMSDAHLHQWYTFPLLIAFLLLVLEILVPIRRHPKAKWWQLWMAMLCCSSAAWGSARGDVQLIAHEQIPQKTLSTYEKLIRKYPLNAAVKYNYALAAYRADEYERAAKIWETLTAHRKEKEISQKILFQIGNAYARWGESQLENHFSQAVPHLREAIAFYDRSAHPKAKYNRELVARLLESLLVREGNKKLKEAEIALKENTPNSPSKAQSLYQQVERLYQEASTLNPQHEKLKHALAETKKRSEQLEKERKKQSPSVEPPQGTSSAERARKMAQEALEYEKRAQEMRAQKNRESLASLQRSLSLLNQALGISPQNNAAFEGRDRVRMELRQELLQQAKRDLEQGQASLILKDKKEMYLQALQEYAQADQILPLDPQEKHRQEEVLLAFQKEGIEPPQATAAEASSKQRKAAIEKYNNELENIRNQQRQNPQDKNLVQQELNTRAQLERNYLDEAKDNLGKSRQTNHPQEKEALQKEAAKNCEQSVACASCSSQNAQQRKETQRELSRQQMQDAGEKLRESKNAFSGEQKMQKAVEGLDKMNQADQSAPLQPADRAFREQVVKSLSQANEQQGKNMQQQGHASASAGDLQVARQQLQSAKNTYALAGDLTPQNPELKKLQTILDQELLVIDRKIEQLSSLPNGDEDFDSMLLEIIRQTQTKPMHYFRRSKSKAPLTDSPPPPDDEFYQDW